MERLRRKHSHSPFKFTTRCSRMTKFLATTLALNATLRLLHFHHAAHDEMMAGEGADEWVFAGGGWGGEVDDLFLAGINQFARPEDVGTLGDEVDLEAFGAQGHRFRADVVGGA